MNSTHDVLVFHTSVRWLSKKKRFTPRLCDEEQNKLLFGTENKEILVLH